MKRSKKNFLKEKPIEVKGSFEDLVKASVKGNPKPKTRKKKNKKEG